MDGRRKSLGQGAREARQFDCPARVGKEKRMEKAMADGLKRAAKARLVGAGLSVALMLMMGVVAPSMAQERLDQDFGPRDAVSCSRVLATRV